MMARKGWSIEETENGVDLSRDGRIVAYDLDDADEAVQVIRKRDPEARSYVLIEPDGYQTLCRF